MMDIKDTEFDTAHLLSQNDDFVVKSKNNRCTGKVFPVEPIAFLNAQFLYAKIGEDMGYDVRNLTLHSNSSCDSNFSDSTTSVREAIQQRTVNVQLYMKLLQTVPSLVIVLYFGVYADMYGRKKLLLLTPFASIFQVITYGIVPYCNLPVYLLFVGNFIYGCLGANAFILMSGRLFLKDSVDEKNLAFRMILLTVCYYLGDVVASLGFNYMLTVTTFVYVYLCVTVTDVITVIYVCFCIEESLPEEKRKPKGSLQISVYLKCLVKVFCRDEHRPRRLWKVYVLILCVFFRYCINFESTYLFLNAPFCWNSVLIGYYDAALVLVS